MDFSRSQTPQLNYYTPQAYNIPIDWNMLYDAVKTRQKERSDAQQMLYKVATSPVDYDTTSGKDATFASSVSDTMKNFANDNADLTKSRRGRQQLLQKLSNLTVTHPTSGTPMRVTDALNLLQTNKANKDLWRKQEYQTAMQGKEDPNYRYYGSASDQYESSKDMAFSPNTKVFDNAYDRVDVKHLKPIKPTLQRDANGNPIKIVLGTNSRTGQAVSLDINDPKIRQKLAESGSDEQTNAILYELTKDALTNLGTQSVLANKTDAHDLAYQLMVDKMVDEQGYSPEEARTRAKQAIADPDNWKDPNSGIQSLIKDYVGKTASKFTQEKLGNQFQTGSGWNNQYQYSESSNPQGNIAGIGMSSSEQMTRNIPKQEDFNPKHENVFKAGTIEPGVPTKYSLAGNTKTSREHYNHILDMLNNDMVKNNMKYQPADIQQLAKKVSERGYIKAGDTDEVQAQANQIRLNNVLKEHYKKVEGSYKEEIPYIQYDSKTNKAQTDRLLGGANTVEEAMGGEWTSKPVFVDGIRYNSGADYLNSNEGKKIVDNQKKARVQYTGDLESANLVNALANSTEFAGASRIMLGNKPIYVADKASTQMSTGKNFLFKDVIDNPGQYIPVSNSHGVIKDRDTYKLVEKGTNRVISTSRSFSKIYDDAAKQRESQPNN